MIRTKFLDKRQPFWIRKFPIIAFSKYGDVKKIYVNEIFLTYIVTRHTNRVFVFYI